VSDDCDESGCENGFCTPEQLGQCASEIPDGGMYSEEVPCESGICSTDTHQYGLGDPVEFICQLLEAGVP